MSVHAQLSRMTAPHGAASVQLSEDAGVPLSEADSFGKLATDLHALADSLMIPYEAGRYLATSESKQLRTFAERLDALVSPVPAPTPEAVQETDPYFVLDFCEGAIRDAITLDDGLDAAAGQSVLTMIANAKAARLATPQPPREGEIHPDSKDAARYRFTREHFKGADAGEGSFTIYLHGAFHPRAVTMNAAGFDNAIDNAIAAAMSATPEGRTHA